MWAHSLVSSRALTLHGRKYLVPFADMFNYSPHKVCWPALGSRCCTELPMQTSGHDCRRPRCLSC